MKSAGVLIGNWTGVGTIQYQVAPDLKRDLFLRESRNSIVEAMHRNCEHAIDALKNGILPDPRLLCNRPEDYVRKITSDFEPFNCIITGSEEQLHNLDRNRLPFVARFESLNSRLCTVDLARSSMAILRPCWYELCENVRTGVPSAEDECIFVIISGVKDQPVPDWIADWRVEGHSEMLVGVRAVIVNESDMYKVYKNGALNDKSTTWVCYRTVRSYKKQKMRNLRHIRHWNQVLTYVLNPMLHTYGVFIDDLNLLCMAFNREKSFRPLESMLKPMVVNKKFVRGGKTIPFHAHNCDAFITYRDKYQPCGCTKFRPSNSRSRCKCGHEHKYLDWNDRARVIHDWTDCTALVPLMRETLESMHLYCGQGNRADKPSTTRIYMDDKGGGPREVNFDIYLMMWFSLCINNPSHARTLIDVWAGRENAIFLLHDSPYFGIQANAYREEWMETAFDGLIKKRVITDQGPNSKLLWRAIHCRGNDLSDDWHDGISTYDPFSKMITVQALSLWCEKCKLRDQYPRDGYLLGALLTQLSNLYNSQIHFGVHNKMQLVMKPLQFVGVKKGDEMYEDDQVIGWKHSRIGGLVHFESFEKMRDTSKVRTAFYPLFYTPIHMRLDHSEQCYIVPPSIFNSPSLLPMEVEST
jgi:hypothetical protein